MKASKTVHAEDAPASTNCVGDFISQYGSTVESALVTWLKGVVTVGNITNCLNCTGEKIEKDLKGTPTQCPPATSTPLPTQGKSRKITNPPAPADGSNGDSSASPAEQFVDFPSGFDENAKLNKSASGEATNWNLAQRSTVVQRWKATT